MAIRTAEDGLGSLEVGEERSRRFAAYWLSLARVEADRALRLGPPLRRLWSYARLRQQLTEVPASLVCEGPVELHGTRQVRLGHAGGDAVEVLARLADGDRIAPDAVAAVVAMLGSTDAFFVTGTEGRIDGGAHT